jgi:hypothetical protein
VALLTDIRRDLLRRVLRGLKEAAFFNWRLAAEESVYERQSQVSPSLNFHIRPRRLFGPLKPRRLIGGRGVVRQEFIEELILSNPELGDRAWLALLRWGGLLQAMTLEQWLSYAYRRRDLRQKVTHRERN